MKDEQIHRKLIIKTLPAQKNSFVSLINFFFREERTTDKISKCILSVGVLYRPNGKVDKKVAETRKRKKIKNLPQLMLYCVLCIRESKSRDHI